MLGPSALYPTITLVVSLLAWCAITRLRIGAMLSPGSISILILASIFAVRPLFLLRDQNFDFYGYSVKEGFNSAALVGLMCVVCLIIGYILGGSARKPDRRNHDPYRDLGFSKLILFSLGLTLFWLALMVYIGGGAEYISTLFAGRSEVNNAVQSGVPNVVAALPMAGALSLCFGRLKAERGRRLTAWEQVGYWTSVVAASVPPTALGFRRFLLPTLLAVAIVAAAKHWRNRPRPYYIPLALAAGLVLVSIPFVRSAGARTSSSSFLGSLFEYLLSQGPTAALQQFFVSYDTEMFNYVAKLQQDFDDGWPLGYGREIVGDTILNPLPGSVSPILWSDEILTRLFGGPCGDPYCPVPSLPGVLFTDFWFYGVIVGSVLFGLLLRYLDNSVSVDPAAVSGAIMVFWALIPTFVRGNSVLFFYLFLQILLICLIAWTFAGARLTRQAMTSRSGTLEEIRC